MSNSIDLLISVPRSSLDDFNSKYLKLVEAFYYVTLSENKLVSPKTNKDCIFFDVHFNLSPSDEHFNPQEIIDRIQRAIAQAQCRCRSKQTNSDTILLCTQSTTPRNMWIHHLDGHLKGAKTPAMTPSATRREGTGLLPELPRIPSRRSSPSTSLSLQPHHTPIRLKLSSPLNWAIQSDWHIQL
ncbi:unnamed protein product [Leptidea sinapis]|uniref:Uncharacterized protein n=1 Tax=Leptidea sinapis TaxID=189913 RepID=A0A5E4PXL9_9NEOP|nr:unnamed protein product [Leptidea sinapis]